MKQTHEIALGLLAEEKEMIVEHISIVKSRLKFLCRMRTTDDTMFNNYVKYYRGNISKLTKDLNVLRGRLHEIEDTQRTLRLDGQSRCDREWAAMQVLGMRFTSKRK